MLKRILLFAVAALFLGACGTNSAQANQITITMTEFAFEPNVITVTAGEPVELTLVNHGVVEHDFVVESIRVKNVSTQGAGDDHLPGSDHAQPDLHASAAVNAASVLRFTPVEAGRYSIICSVPGHKEAGMVGELIVK